MTKKLVAVTLILITISSFFGCSFFGKESEKVGIDGMVFLGTASESNEYYQPFSRDILAFHKAFESEKSPKDGVLSLSYEDTGYDDIWIRDVAPVVTTRLVKFVYAPKNLSREDSEYLNDSFTDWLEDNEFQLEYSLLVLDGGNFIWNKKDTVIITTRILEDNPQLSQGEIISQLKSNLAVNSIILIPPEEGDVLAHADGMVKFIDEDTLFISDFLGDQGFRKQIEETILKDMPNATFVVMSSAYTEEGQYDDEIASAKGLYINILETENAWYVPKFSLPEDEEMADFIREYTDKPVIPLEIQLLSTMGGAVNCLTWYCPVRFLPPHFTD